MLTMNSILTLFPNRSCLNESAFSLMRLCMLKASANSAKFLLESSALLKRIKIKPENNLVLGLNYDVNILPMVLWTERV